MYTEDFSLSQIIDIIKVLARTIPLYVDAASRSAVQAVLVELVKHDEALPQGKKLGVIDQFIGWIVREVGLVSKNGSARCVDYSMWWVAELKRCDLLVTRLRTYSSFYAGALHFMLSILLQITHRISHIDHL